MVEKCWRRVLYRSVGEERWQHWCKKMSGIQLLLFDFFLHSTFAGFRCLWRHCDCTRVLALLYMCILHFVSILLTLLISAILSKISCIKLSSFLSGYPASSFEIWQSPQRKLMGRVYIFYFEKKNAKTTAR